MLHIISVVILIVDLAALFLLGAILLLSTVTLRALLCRQHGIGIRVAPRGYVAGT